MAATHRTVPTSRPGAPGSRVPPPAAVLEQRLTTHVEAFGVTDVGCQRSNNEDALLLANARRRPARAPSNVATFSGDGVDVLLAVSDGMGGEAAGEVASAVAVDALHDAVADLLEGVSPAAALRCAFDAANRAVLREGTKAEREGMGATLTAALLVGPHAYVASVGDSRAYLFRSDKLVRLTRDQSYAQLLVDRGALNTADVADFPYRNVLLQAIGRAEVLAVPLLRLELRQGDRLLLCSDGLTGEVADEELARLLGEDVELDACGAHLVETANAHGGSDNITAVLASVHGMALPTSAGDETVAATVQDLTDNVDAKYLRSGR